MLYDISELRGFTPLAKDGEIGSIADVYFSDDTWTLRYLVIDAGGWLTGRKVLVTPRAMHVIDAAHNALRLDLTREQIKNSPDYDSDKPVSRQYEADYFAYYGYPYYWSGPYLWGLSDYPVPPGAPIGAPSHGSEEALHTRAARERAAGDPHLRSAEEVSGYAIEASDGAIGHVQTLLFDDAKWRVEAIVIDTRNWWPGKHVVVSPGHISAIEWDERRVRVNLTRDQIKSSAEYDPESHVGDRREERIAAIRHALHFGD